MYLFFDTETTGLPRNYKAPVTDLNNWPRMIQIAWILYDNKGTLVESQNAIIIPDGFSIPDDAAKIHGITTARALNEGVELYEILSGFQSLTDEVDYLVAHNISFDEKIAGAEFLRMKMPNKIPSKRRICTMESSVNYCALPGKYGYKWPKLSELHYKLFNTGFEEAHNAAVDIEVTAKCFWEMKKRGIL